MRNGGQLLVESLIGLGAVQSFGVPGESYLAVLDALHDTAGKLDFTMCRNEGGAAFMAAAYGKLTRSPGICFVTRGPGVTNASIGVHTAMQDSAPMLLFVGQVGTDQQGREAFQEINYRAVFGTMAKWAVEIDDVDRIPEILSRAWTLATSGRPGPVVIALPENMLTSMSDSAPLTRPVVVREAAVAEDTIAEATELLAKSKRPLDHRGWLQLERRRQSRLAVLCRGLRHPGCGGLSLSGPIRQPLALFRRRGRRRNAAQRAQTDR